MWFFGLWFLGVICVIAVSYAVRLLVL